MRKSQRILIVEDMAFTRTVIRQILESKGYCNVISASNIAHALELTFSQKPHLVILDLIMPDGTGIDYCQRLKDEGYPEIPILLLSATTKTKDIAEAFAAGATDYIRKPIQPDELIGRLEFHIERRSMKQRLEKFDRRLVSELEVARKMQGGLMPSSAMIEEVSRRYQIDIAGVNDASEELGGDFWGLHPLSDDLCAISIVDFSGKGIVAALNVFRMHTLLLRRNIFADSPATTLKNINSYLHPLLDAGQFATMQIIYYDRRQKAVTIASAGAPKPVVMAADNPCQLIDIKGVPVGVRAGVYYEECRYEVSKGLSLLCYSDALIESHLKKKKPISEEQLVDLMSDYSGLSSEEIVRNLYDKLIEEHGGRKFRDDLTIIAFQVAESDS